MKIKGTPRCKFKDMCRRFCAIVGVSGHQVDLDCVRCQSAVCDAQCFQDRDEVIIFDFGSKTTWFKYASESTGQLSMHPTVGPCLEEKSVGAGEPSNVIECCPICIKFAKRKTASMCDLSSPFPEVKIPRPCHHPHRRGLASAFSKLSLRNLQCFDGIDSDEEVETQGTITAEGGAHQPKDRPKSPTDTSPTPSSGEATDDDTSPKEEDCPRCPDQVTMYKFLMKHMLRRNPFFQVRPVLMDHSMEFNN